MKERRKSVILRGPGLPGRSNCKEQKPLEKPNSRKTQEAKAQNF